MRKNINYKMTLSDLPDKYYAGKRVLLRVDLNVPVAKDGEISEDYRIRRTIPTIKYLLNRRAKVIIISHLGRPGGKVVKSMSLQPLCDKIAGMLGLESLGFVKDCTGEIVKNKVNGMSPGDALLLENLRFHEGETKNDPVFAEELSALADIYVNDAFSTSHRKHASTYGIQPYFEYKLAGFLVSKEMEVLNKLRHTPDRPFVLVIGGAKIRDKITALSNLILRADKVLLGGGPAYTFMGSEGIPVGNSINEPEYFSVARDIKNKHDNKILLPLDHVAENENTGETMVSSGGIPEGYRGVDIGPETISFYTRQIMTDGQSDSMGTIFWNGPMGMFENDQFAHGTTDIARAISIAYWRGAFTVVGGGDTTAGLRKANVLETEVDFVSTGGGATLMYLGDEEIPGIQILNKRKQD